MAKRIGALVALPTLFIVGAGCVSGSSEPTGSQGLASGGGSSPGMSTTIESQYGMTVFGGAGDCQSLACGGSNSCSSQPWYSASSQRYGCGVHLQVTANGKCVVVQTEDAGPASWVEADAGIAILDSGPQVAQYLFGTSSIGWSDIKNNPGKYVVQVSTTSEGLGPCSATGDAGAGASTGSGDGGAAGDDGGSGGGPGASGGGPGSSGGGSGGSGGGGSKGGGSGSGSKGGGSGGADGGAYAFIQRGNVNRHYPIDLAMGASRSISFVWRDVSGLAPPADLWVEADGRPLLQVASVDGHPFARSGLEVVELDPGVSYRLVLERHDTLSASVMGSGGEVMIRAQGRAANMGAAFDVVRPGELLRSSIASDLF